MLKAIHAHENRVAARQKAEDVCRGVGAHRDRRDAVPLSVSARALAIVANEQPAGAHPAGSAADQRSQLVWVEAFEIRKNAIHAIH
jgi:hypothetical protein